MPHSFPRKERIKGSILPSILFTNGALIKESPLQCRVLASKNNSGRLRVLFAVPKKRIPSAVCRNRIRRQMREVWRQNSEPLRELCLSEHTNLMAGIYFQSNEAIPFELIEVKIKNIIGRLIQQYAKTNR